MFQFPWSASRTPMDSACSAWLLHHAGFPIRISPDQCLLTAPRGSFVVRHVLLRLLAPRHPPCALANLSSRSYVVLAAPHTSPFTFTRSRPRCAKVAAMPTYFACAVNFGCLTLVSFPNGKSHSFAIQFSRNKLVSWWTQAGSNR